MADVDVGAMTKSWTASGTAYMGIGLDITNTASAAGSRIFRIRVGGAEKISVDVSGNATFAGTLAAASFPSPTLTGTPVAPTPTPLDNSTKIATTAYADLAVGVLSTSVAATYATSAGVTAGLALKANLISPSFTTPALGTPTDPASEQLAALLDFPRLPVRAVEKLWRSFSSLLFPSSCVICAGRNVDPFCAKSSLTL